MMTRAFLISALCTLGCTTEDVDVPVEDTASQGNSQTSTQSNTASSTTGGNMCDPAGACRPLVASTPAILTFSDNDGEELVQQTPTFGELLSEVTDQEEWHISGTVNTWSGFEIKFKCVTDASAFRGVTFTVRGNVGSNTIAVSANTAGNSSHNNCMEPHNTCSGACENSKVSFELSDEPKTISVEWSDFAGGIPNAQPDPSELIGLAWVFGWSDGASPYEVDVTIDDIEFLE